MVLSLLIGLGLSPIDILIALKIFMERVLWSLDLTIIGATIILVKFGEFIQITRQIGSLVERRKIEH